MGIEGYYEDYFDERQDESERKKKMRTETEVSSRISYLMGIIKGLELSVGQDEIEIDRLISDYKNQVLGLQYALNIKELKNG